MSRIFNFLPPTFLTITFVENSRCNLLNKSLSAFFTSYLINQVKSSFSPLTSISQESFFWTSSINSCEFCPIPCIGRLESSIPSSLILTHYHEPKVQKTLPRSSLYSVIAFRSVSIINKYKQLIN